MMVMTTVPREDPPERQLRWYERLSRTLVSAPIVVYRYVISPGLPRRCKYEPTCSRYAVQAIWEYGILRGLVLAVWRLLRCNPWSRGGFDPVAAQGVFKTSPRRASNPANEHVTPAGR
jgi:putative membrane protein insertion efficiency factor